MKHKLLISVLVCITLIGLVLANFDMGDKEYEIDNRYAKGDSLRGWINISLDEEPYNSLLNAFSDNITLLEFLNNSNADFECYPNENQCEGYYTSQNGEETKLLTLNAGEEELIGFKLIGELVDYDPIKEASFRIDSTALKSCNQPLKIDVGDDGTIDWQFFGSLQDYTCSYSTGCFDVNGDTRGFDIGTTPYCQKISLPSKPVFRVGADISVGDTETPVFSMGVYDLDLGFLAGCDIPYFTTDGRKSCEVYLNLTNVTDVFICINADKSTNYQIQGENEEPCGFYGFDYDNFTSDYYIFAEGGKFAPLGDFVLDDDEFLGYSDYTFRMILNEYIERFDRDCENGCTIPIRLISGAEQQITLSNLDLLYGTTAGEPRETKFYDVSSGVSKIIMNYTKLDLVHADLQVPDSTGVKTLRLKLGSDTIAKQSIDIGQISQIVDVSPKTAPAAVPTIFYAVVDPNVSGITYDWDFGDGGGETTTTNYIEYTYTDTGTFNLTLTISVGESQTSKSYSVEIKPPKEAVNSTLIKYRSDLDNVLEQIETLPDWIEREVKRKARIETLDNQITALEARLNSISSGDNQAYTDLMRNLTAMKVPYQMQTSLEVNPGPFFQNNQQFDFTVLEDLGAGVQSDAMTRNDYLGAINAWLIANVDVTMQAKTYSLNFRDSSEVPVYTYMKFVIEPKEDIDELYFVISGDPADIVFEGLRDTADISGVASGIIYYDISTVESIEFLYPDSIDLSNVPVYLSPSLSEVDSEVSPIDNEICIVDGNCDKNSGENKDNCRADCKSWTGTLLWLIILLFVAFIVYIILQEWYKKHYESHLFKNRNQLFNLINFISTSTNQGLKKEQIYENLEKMGWNKEQLDYAWKRFHGQRTGMWEIPVFKVLEKKQVKKELEKRRGFQVRRPARPI